MYQWQHYLNCRPHAGTADQLKDAVESVGSLTDTDKAKARFCQQDSRIEANAIIGDAELNLTRLGCRCLASDKGERTESAKKKGHTYVYVILIDNANPLP